MSHREQDERIAQLRLKRLQIKDKFMRALNCGQDQEAGRLDEEDRIAFKELYELLAERAKQ